MKNIIAIILLILLMSVTMVDGVQKSDLKGFLEKNWKSPEAYITDKFNDKDIIFLAELHHVKNLVEFVRDLIPHLYKAGVYDLGIEFGAFEMQQEVDGLLSATEYDEELARQIVFNWSVLWGYSEYQELYRKAWELNRSLPADAPRFRIVHIDYRPRWDKMTEQITSDLTENPVFHLGPRDNFMAKVIDEEFIKKNRKALVYCGPMHAVTNYYQPMYNPDKGEVLGFRKDRAGNQIYDKIRDRAFTIFLHFPWLSRKEMKTLGMGYPAGGEIDSVMREFDNKRAGFGTVGTPFGRLKDDASFYSVGYDNFTLDMICHGYIFIDHFENFKNCTIDKKFITDKNLAEAIRNLPSLEARKDIKTPEDIYKLIRADFPIEEVMKKNNLK